MKKYIIPLGMWILFEIIAITLWIICDNSFYLLNFSYIGTCLAIGIALYANNFKYARNVIQVFIGLYMLVYLGVLSNENMQIEGFWYYLFLGVFEAAVIHYAVAKIFGPVLFGRGWCGYACWTAMVLDLLPYRTANHSRKPIGFIRYIIFMASFIFIVTLFVLHIGDIRRIMFWSFIIGNVLYYGVGVVLAFTIKDNRAFCKYICPITIFLKPASYFSLLRIKIDDEKCIVCERCKKVCPMDVDMMVNSRKRTNGTECILCLNCINVCPKNALHL